MSTRVFRKRPTREITVMDRIKAQKIILSMRTQLKRPDVAKYFGLRSAYVSMIEHMNRRNNDDYMAPAWTIEHILQKDSEVSSGS